MTKVTDTTRKRSGKRSSAKSSVVVPPLRTPEVPLPSLPTVEEVRKRLALVFPESFPDRGLLVGEMAARVIFVLLYGGSVEDHGRFFRPSHIYLFTDEQSQKTSKAERLAWLATATRPGYRPDGKRWYADTSRESIRDDLMRNQLHLRLGVMQKLPGKATTASTPINYLNADFAGLFAPTLAGTELQARVAKWRDENLDPATLQRMALLGRGIEAQTGDVFVDMPDGSRMRISAGPSALIAKALIEDFASIHLVSPQVLWLSASDKKSYPQFVELAASVGLEFNLSAELPDLIVAEMTNPIRFVMCEVVATDGPITETRKKALLGLMQASAIPESQVALLSAFDDRGAPVLRKCFSSLALNSLVWFRTEPGLLVTLTSTNRDALIARS